MIEDEAEFKAALQQAAAAAERGEMVLFGIPATAPETGYGYIKTGSNDGLPTGVSRVERFVEKPDAVTATEYVASGDYCWNSGIFLFRASRFLEELKKHDTDIYGHLPAGAGAQQHRRHQHQHRLPPPSPSARTTP